MTIKGMSITVGRVFASMRRADVVARVEALGASVSHQVTEGTDAFTHGALGVPSAKKGDVKKDLANQRRARALGVPIFSEIGWLARLERAARGGEATTRVSSPTIAEAGTLTLRRRWVVHDAGGDYLYGLSEGMGNGDLESLAICALMEFGGPSDTIVGLIEDEIIGPWVHGWDEHLSA